MLAVLQPLGGNQQQQEEESYSVAAAAGGGGGEPPAWQVPAAWGQVSSHTSCRGFCEVDTLWTGMEQGAEVLGRGLRANLSHKGAACLYPPSLLRSAPLPLAPSLYTLYPSI